jgi:hypothetical protein
MPRKSKMKTRRSKRNLRKTQKNKSRQQRKYYMIGCNNNKCRCSCHRRKGGSSPVGGLEIKTGGGCIGPLVGAPYSVDKGGNYYDLPEPIAYSVDRNMQLRGGGIIPTNLVNVGRQIGYGAQSLYNGLGGFEPPTDPKPYVQNKI